METAVAAGIAARSLVIAALAYGVVRFVRSVRAASPLVGSVIAAGVVLRVVLGLMLFWVSYLNLPIARSLHTGDGFWELAPDAEFYMYSGVLANDVGLDVIRPGSASPMYVRLLALWMRLIGMSPASGMLLNLAAFVLTCGLLTRYWGVRGGARDRWCAFLIACFAFSPVLLIHGTQAMKDELFALLIAWACLGAALVLRGLAVLGTGGSLRGLGGGLTILLVALVLMAGIRAYYVFMLLGCFLPALAYVALFGERRAVGRRLVAATTVTLLILSTSAYGAGPYLTLLLPPDSAKVIQSGGRVSLTPISFVRGLITRVSNARAGFARTGGGTTIADATDRQAARDNEGGNGGSRNRRTMIAAPYPGEGSTLRAGRGPNAARNQGVPGDGLRMPEMPRTLSDVMVHVRRTLIGVVSLVVPVSLLKALSVVTFTGGRGLLAVTDIDTLFVDATCLAALVLLYRTRRELADAKPYAVCVLALAVLSAGLLAYVVTNFGTLFRLRLLMAVPIWMTILIQCTPERTDA